MAREMSYEPGSSDRAAGNTYRGPTGWVGWIIFAAVMMMIAGALNAIHGIVAIVNDEWVVWTNRGDLYLDLTTWGWVHLAIGIVLVLSGIGLLTGNIVARAVAVVVAGVAIIANFMYIPAFPLWTLTVIAISSLVIWAVTAHGGEMRAVR